MIQQGILNENIFHVSGLHFQVLSAKIMSGLNPSIQDLVIDKTLRNASTTYEDLYVDYFTQNFSTSKDVAVLPLIGTMSRYGYWSYGNEFLMKCLERIDLSDQYKGVVFKTNTPGGTADSCAAFADAVIAFKKPKIMHVESVCGSAGVFVGSQFDEIFLENQASTIYGSIGTYILYQNYMGYFKNQGIQFEYIRAEGSEDKVRINEAEELTEELRAELVARATAGRKEFIGYVRRGRAGKIKSEEVFTGKEYNATEAIKLGLADRKGTLKDAVNRVIQLSK